MHCCNTCRFLRSRVQDKPLLDQEEQQLGHPGSEPPSHHCSTAALKSFRNSTARMLYVSSVGGKVGGQRYEQEKTREIADIALKELRDGKDVPSVKSIVDSWLQVRESL